MFGVDDLVIAACVSGVWGYFKHKSADEKNREAQNKIQEGRERYTAATTELKQKTTSTMEAFANYGSYKHFVMDTSIKRFYHAYQEFGNIEILEHNYNTNLPALMIKPEEIQEMHQAALSFDEKLLAAGKGGAAGAILAVAASGYLPVVAELTSVAGSAVLLGELELGGAILGTAGSLAASAVTLPVILGPALLFTGYSAENRAEENLSNARAYVSEVDLAIEKMKTRGLKLDAVNRNTLMFATQIRKINKLFIASVNLLEIIAKNHIKKWWQFWKSDKIDVNDLTDDEIKVIQVSAVLAGYMKRIMDTPVLQKDDLKTTQASLDCYDECGRGVQRIEGLLNAAEKSVVFNRTDIERIDSSAIEAQNIDPDSERARELMEESETNESETNESGSILRKLLLLLLLAVALFIGYRYIWPVTKEDPVPPVSSPATSSSKYESSGSSKDSTPVKQEAGIDSSTPFVYPPDKQESGSEKGPGAMPDNKDREERDENSSNASAADTVIKMRSYTDPELCVSFVYPENIPFVINGSGLAREGKIRFSDTCSIKIDQELANSSSLEYIMAREKRYVQYEKDVSVREIPNNGYELRYYAERNSHTYVVDKVYLVGKLTKHMRLVYSKDEPRDVLNMAEKIQESFTAKQ